MHQLLSLRKSSHEMIKRTGRSEQIKEGLFAAVLYAFLVITGAVLGVSFVSRDLSTDSDINNFSTASPSKTSAQCGEPVFYERDASDLFFIMVSINGKALPMLIDTGATNSSLPSNFSYALSSDPSEEKVKYLPLETANGFTSAEIFPSQSLHLNGSTWQIDMLLLQSHSDSGILGMDVLGNLDMVINGRVLKLTSPCVDEPKSNG